MAAAVPCPDNQISTLNFCLQAPLRGLHEPSGNLWYGSKFPRRASHLRACPIIIGSLWTGQDSVGLAGIPACAGRSPALPDCAIRWEIHSHEPGLAARKSANIGLVACSNSDSRLLSLRMNTDFLAARNSNSNELTDFQAVILAGGRGTRMLPITAAIPKPMIPVNGKPFLHYQLELLARFGLRRALLLVAYLGEQIEAYFGKGAGLGMDLTYSHEQEPLGTGGALKNAAVQLDPHFVVLNGDTYLPIDYCALLQSFRAKNNSAMIVAYRPVAKASEDLLSRLPKNLAVSVDGRVTAYRKREPEGLTHIDAGVLVLRKEILDMISPRRKCSLEEEIFPQLIAQHRMEAWATTEAFYDMGTPAGLDALSARLG